MCQYCDNISKVSKKVLMLKIKLVRIFNMLLKSKEEI